MDETENECQRQCDDPTAPVGKSPADVVGEGRFQFTLSELLTVVTCGAVGLAGARWLPGGWFALVLGFWAFLGIVFVGICKAPRIVKLVAWALLATYILAAAATVALNWTAGEDPSPAAPGDADGASGRSALLLRKEISAAHLTRADS